MFEPQISLSIEQYDAGTKTQLVRFDGQLDSLGFAKIKDQILVLIEQPGAEIFVFDFEKLTFLNSESIGFLMYLYTHLKKSGRTIRLLHLNSHVKDVLETVGLLNIFSS